MGISLQNIRFGDSLAERDEFELPVPICEQSDDSIRFKLCNIEANC
jgi:hypothetical protein